MILSICIPSYDRFEKLNETIANILQAKSDNFEVVVVDNCSPRDICEYIKYDDSRLRFVKRENPVYGGKSVSDSILYAKGEYALLLLDKDTICGEYLDEFVDVLSYNKDVMGGYCVLNSKNQNVKVVSKKTIKKFGYLSKHPSGNFYKIDRLRDYIEKKEDEMEKDPFAFDIYMAYCASLGKMMMYDKKLVCSTLDNMSNKDTGSLTFSKNKGNVYYLVPNRIWQFKKYISCLMELNVTKNDKKDVLLCLYHKTIRLVTIDYRNIMRNKEVCNHYGHEPERVGILKMLCNVLRVRWAFIWKKCDGVNYFEKLKMDFKIVHSEIKRKMYKHKNGG